MADEKGKGFQPADFLLGRVKESINGISDKIADFYETDLKDNKDKMKHILDLTFNRYNYAVKVTDRNFIYIIIILAIVCLMASGLIDEASIFSFKILHLRSILVISPAVIGFAIYRYYTCLVNYSNIAEIYRYLFGKEYPKAGDFQLFALFHPTHISEYEMWTLVHHNLNIRKKTDVRILWFLIKTSYFIIAYIPIMSFILVTIFIYYLNEWSIKLVSLFVVIGVLFVFRGGTVARLATRGLQKKPNNSGVVGS